MKNHPALCANTFLPQAMLLGEKRNHRFQPQPGTRVLCVSMVSICDSLTSCASSPEPCFSCFPTDTRQYPVFVGHKPGRNTTQRHRLDIQLVMVMNRTLYVAARSVAPSFTTPSLLLAEQKGGEERYSEFFSAGHVIFRIFSHSERGLQPVSKTYWTPC